MSGKAAIPEKGKMGGEREQRRKIDAKEK